VPTLNEGANIDPLLSGCLPLSIPATPWKWWWSTIQSTDDTVARAETLGRRLSGAGDRASGKPDLSGSVLDGAGTARGRWVVVMDADGSHPPEAIPALLAPLRDGSHDHQHRLSPRPGGATVGWPWHRHMASGIATMLAWPFTEVRDPMAGFFATSRSRLLALPGHAAGYKILLEMLVQGGDRIRTTEVPIRFEDRHHGQSKLGLSQQVTYLKRLAYLGGGRVSLGSASKFILVGLSGMLIDLLIFHFLISSGVRLGSAHIGSFLVATITNFLLNYRWTFQGDAHASHETHVPATCASSSVAVLALMMRGGVLVLLVEVFGLSAMAAIIAGHRGHRRGQLPGGGILRVCLDRLGRNSAGALAPGRHRIVRLCPGAENAVHGAPRADSRRNVLLGLQPAPGHVLPRSSAAGGWLIAMGTRFAWRHVLGVRLMLIPLTLVGAVFRLPLRRHHGRAHRRADVCTGRRGAAVLYRIRCSDDAGCPDDRGLGSGAVLLQARPDR
jgi:putative flippase GtrA